MKSTAGKALLASALVLAGFAPVTAATAPPSVAKNKEVVRQWFEDIILKEDIGKLDQLVDKNVHVEFAPGYSHSASGMVKFDGIDELRSHLKALGEKSNVTGKIVDLIGEDDKVALYRTATVTYTDGKSATTPWMTFFHFKNGKIISMVHLHDTASENQQLSGQKP